MKRRSRASGGLTKGRRRKAAKPIRRNAPKVALRSNSSSNRREDEVARLTRELRDALEQQAATSEVLQVISGSAGDLQRVFAAMLENAVRICDATFGVIYRWDGEFLHTLASHKTPPALAEARRRSPIRPRPDMARGPAGRAAASRVRDIPNARPDRSMLIEATRFTTKPHGIGLGLAICRMIVERHGGQLTAASDGNNGAQFQFVLPTEFVDAAQMNSPV